MADWQWQQIAALAPDAETAGRTLAWFLLFAPLMRRQLETRAYPGQPTHHSAPPVRPCSCAYHVVQTPADGHLIVPTYHHSPGLTLEDEHDEGAWFYSVWTPRCPVLSWFTIRRSCPHHGRTLEL